MNYRRTKSWLKFVRRLKFHNRKYKDRLFQRVFQDKRDLLDLYNAINGTNHQDPEELEITTLEDVIFMSMKNDKSFIISSTMNLYEHQSTVNPNMPIRGLLYFAQLYDEYIKLHDLNMYGHKLIKLPMPQYIVFYNGTEQIPDDHTLVLSDAFESDPTANEMEPALECKARVMNVNSGHNAELMNKCKRLMHYSVFIARIRQNTNNGMSVEQAIDEAITYCIDHDILKDVLLKNRSEVRHMLLTEFDEKKFAKSMWEEGRESGYTEGHESGYTEGHESGYTEGHDFGYTQGRDSILEIMDEINKGNDTIEKLVALGYDANVVTKVLEKK